MSELVELATADKVFLSISNGDRNAEESDPNSVTSKKVSLAPFYNKKIDGFEDTIINEYSENEVTLKKMTLKKDGREFVGFLVPGKLGRLGLSEDDYKSQKYEVETADSSRGDNELLKKKNNVAIYESLKKLFGNTDKEILLNSKLKEYDYIAPFFYLQQKGNDYYYGLLYPKQVIKIKYKIEITTQSSYFYQENRLSRTSSSFTPKFTLYEWKARFPLVEELKILFNHNFIKYSGAGLLTLGEGETKGQINQEYKQTHNFEIPEPVKGDIEAKVDLYTGELTTKNLAFNAFDYYLRPEVQSCVNMRRNQYYYSYYDWHGHHWRYVREADIDYYDANGVCHFGYDSDNDTNEAWNGGMWENNYPSWTNLRFSIEALDGMHKTFNKNMFVSYWNHFTFSGGDVYHKDTLTESPEWFHYIDVKNWEEVLVGWIDSYTPKYEWQWVTHKQPKTFWLELVIDY